MSSIALASSTRMTHGIRWTVAGTSWRLRIRMAGYERFTATSFWNSITREMWASVRPHRSSRQILAWAADGVGQGACPLPVKSDAQPGFACRKTGMDSTIRPVMDATSVSDWPVKASVRQSRDAADRRQRQERRGISEVRWSGRPCAQTVEQSAWPQCFDHLATAFYTLFGE